MKLGKENLVVVPIKERPQSALEKEFEKHVAAVSIEERLEEVIDNTNDDPNTGKY